MGLQDVKKKIVEEAESKAKLLMNEGHVEIKKIESSVTKEIQEYEKMLRHNAEEMLKTIERKERAAAEFEGKRLLLDAKKAIIEEVMQETRKRLQKLSMAERQKLLERLMKKAAKEIDVKKVYVNPKDKPLVHASGVTLVEKDLLGGFIAETVDGRISVDLSFETMLEQIQQEYLRDIGEVLFT